MRLFAVPLLLAVVAAIAVTIHSDLAKAQDHDGDGRFQNATVAAVSDPEFGTCTLLDLQVGTCATGDNSFDVTVSSLQTGRILHRVSGVSADVPIAPGGSPLTWRYRTPVDGHPPGDALDIQVIFKDVWGASTDQECIMVPLP